jgi:protein-tyrosine-phosphatase
MDPITYTIVFDLVLAVAAYGLKNMFTEQKEKLEKLYRQHEEHQKEMTHVRDTYFKKEDFTEFRKELWARLDRLEDDIKAERTGRN